MEWDWNFVKVNNNSYTSRIYHKSESNTWWNNYIKIKTKKITRRKQTKQDNNSYKELH